MCSLLALLLLWATTIVAQPQRFERDYENRIYYTFYTPSGASEAASIVAQQLGARFEGQVGELPQYYWVSESRHQLDKRSDGDLVERFQKIRERRKHGNSDSINYNKRRRRTVDDLIDQIERVDRQVPRRRLHKRGVLPVKRQVLDDDNSLYPPVVENVGEEQTANHEAVPVDWLLDQPDGFETLKQSLGIEDPGFEQQWHLVNQEQRGHDVNVTGVWSQGITGQNVVVAILDDGLDMESEDLKDNFFAAGSYDFNARTELPKPRLEDDNHGTRCAGEIAAVKNDVCGVGMAYGAKVAGIRILSEDITDAEEAEALNYKYHDNHIYSCSWGPPDLGEVAEAPQGIVLDAIVNGIQKGRNGSGTIFVFASGNGGANDDNCNFDGYTNSMYTITVGAIDRLGNHPYYAERCSAQLVVTYSSGSGGHIYTTDVGRNVCSSRHGGTSAAAPLAAGIFALVLSVRPDLTWRDMQHLCVQTAVPVSIEDSDWDTLPSGRMYNHKFGYGKLDAYAIVEHAKTFENVGPQTYLQLSLAPADKQDIPDLTDLSGNVDKNDALTSTITVTQEMVDAAGLGRMEHVTATVNIEHGRRGDLETLLESPSDIVSQLGASRKFDASTEGLVDWTFMTVKHWEENPVGNWTLRIVDGKNPQFTGKFINWTLTIWGEMAPGFESIPVHTPIQDDQFNNPTLAPGEYDPDSPIGNDDSDVENLDSADPEQESSIPPNNGNGGSPSSNQDEAAVSPQPIIPTLLDTLDRPRDDHRSFFAYIIGVLLVVVVGGTVATIVRKRLAAQQPASQTTAYTGVNRHDADQYEFDVLRNHSRRHHYPQHPPSLERVSEEAEDDVVNETSTFIPTTSVSTSSNSSTPTSNPMSKRQASSFKKSSADVKGKAVLRSPSSA
ncbi:peptidase S8/S53 domain-containing protein [Zychaea mexicana]|uniref:peptidase S8/S53 domain-containing protein n=1 Tax=Zychaea mexicana TaxID=64656 RepID=UPI0022FF15CC|nr:peptidase S8/S53 domain-containing protein [Zychaea mexicana]KAI9485066.1 peptidase S8/S53 domain-containing protein [Zychaea mexicana]